MTLASIDLNLFVVLDAVLSERSVTRAAQRLHVTPSAVSNSLARLRDLFADPLVVRSGRGLAPTPRAVQLAPQLAASLGQITGVLNHGRRFVPSETTRSFTLAAADNHLLCEVPRVIEAFSRKLPRATLRVVSADYLVAGNGLRTGEVDVAFGPPQMVPKGCRSAELYDEVGVFVVRRGHPRVRRQMTPALFNSLKHIDVAGAMGQAGVGGHMVQQVSQKQGLARDVAVIVPHFVAAAATAARTDCVAALPLRAAELMCGLLGLKLVRATFETTRVTTALIWHMRTDADAGNQFVRQLITGVVIRPLRGLRQIRATS